jgi:hypothetical protein
MEEKFYCIVDNTIDSTTSIEGLTGLTLEQATEWLAANNADGKFSIEKDNWQEEA